MLKNSIEDVSLEKEFHKGVFFFCVGGLVERTSFSDDADNSIFAVRSSIAFVDLHF